MYLVSKAVLTTNRIRIVDRILTIDFTNAVLIVTPGPKVTRFFTTC